jgi:DDE family transposase
MILKAARPMRPKPLIAILMVRLSFGASRKRSFARSTRLEVRCFFLRCYRKPKKKELLGEFYRDGVIDAQEAIAVNDHDFGSAGSGVVIPHGIYDVGLNRGYVHLNASHDTSELACDSL